MQLFRRIEIILFLSLKLDSNNIIDEKEIQILSKGNENSRNIEFSTFKTQ